MKIKSLYKIYKLCGVKIAFRNLKLMFKKPSKELINYSKSFTKEDLEEIIKEIKK